MNSYLTGVTRRGITEALDQEEQQRLQDEAVDTAEFYGSSRTNTDASYKEEFEEDESFLSKTGKFFTDVLSLPEKLDKAVGIYDTRQKAISTLTGGLSNQHMIAALAGELLVPDTLDLVTLGLGYIPRRILTKGPKAIKMFLKTKKAGLPKAALRNVAEEIPVGRKIATEADYDAMFKGAEQVSRATGRPVDDILQESGMIHKVDTNPSGINWSTLEEAEEAFLNEDALEAARRLRDAKTDADFAKIQAETTQDILKANRTVKGDGSAYIPTLKDKGISEAANVAFGRAGFRNGVFDYKNWITTRDRRIMEFFGTIGKRYSSGKYGNYNTAKNLLQPIMEKEFDYFFKKYPVKAHKLELHHIVPLNIGAKLYDGLTYQSDEWYELMETFFKKGVFPGAQQVSDNPITNLPIGNLTELLYEPHYILHQKYFKDVLGTPQDNFSKFFNAERIAKIDSGQAGRLAVASEYADILKEGDVLVKRMMGQIQQAYGKSNLSDNAIENFNELTDLFWEMTQDGKVPALTSKFTGKSYASKAVNDQLLDIVQDMIYQQALRKGTIRFKVRLSKPQQKILFSSRFTSYYRDIEESALSAAQLQKKYKGDLNQMQFIFEEIPPSIKQNLRNMRKD
tara:strand:- start:108 stop:1982 length:1875 start_codon:yes stop_codon:yes gene_type:complete